MKILISGLGGSLFPYLHDQLKSKYELYYVDSDQTLREIYGDINFFAAPLVRSSEYPEFIRSLIQKHHINVYIPLIDEEIIIAHELAEKIPGLILVSPEISFCNLALRKNLLMDALKAHGISNIATWTGDQFRLEEGKIYFVKPISGRGSRGIRKISSVKELEAYYILENYKPNEVMVQEFIEGQEYTVGALLNKQNELLYISSRKVIAKKGITIKAVTEHNQLINDSVAKINQYMQPKGPINVQLYITPTNEIKIFEINPRFSTTSIMSYHAGIDEISLWLEFADKKFNQPPLSPPDNLVLRRRWENIFYEQH